MIRKLAFITIVFCLARAHADPTIWQGYRPTKNVTLPFAKTAMQSVVRIVSFSISKEDINDPSKIKIVEVSKTKAITDPKLLIKYTGNLQIETCRRQGLEHCPVLPLVVQGSGFFSSGDQLYTCRHDIHNWVVLASKANNISPEKIVPAMLIFDSKNKVIYNSATSKSLLSFDVFNSDSRLNHPIINDVVDPEETLYSLSDFVGLRADSKLVDVATTPTSLELNMGDVVYMSGYPGHTKLFSGGKGDAPGNTLVSSVGQIIAFQTPQRLFASNALATDGLSGGMVSREDGTIVGVVCRSNEEKTDFNPKIFTTSVYFDVAGLERIWLGFENQESPPPN